MSKISNNSGQRVNGINSKIYWDSFFSNDEVDRIIEYCSATELQTATISQNSPTVNDSIRISNINFHTYNSQNSWIFDRVNFGIEDINNKFYHFDLCGYDYFQYSEYDGSKAGKYDFHMDLFTDEESYINKLTRKLSFVVLLSEPEVDFEGGEFQINSSLEKNQLTIEMKKGSLIAFPSFMIHRVTPVTKGVRKSIAIWVEGPKFK